MNSNKDYTKDFQFSKCLNQQGYLNYNQLFVNLYNCLPQTLGYHCGSEEIKIEEIDKTKFQELFPDFVFVYTTTKSGETTSCVDDKDDDYEAPGIMGHDIYLNGEWYSYEVYAYSKTRQIVFTIDCDSICIYYNQDDAESILNTIMDNLPIEYEEPEGATVRLIAFSNEYYTISSKIEPTELNITENYNDDFIAVDESIKKFLKDRKSGLVVLHGSVGSGKTSYIRNLITTMPNKYILITTAMASHLAAPEFISFLMEHKDSVFILEDCEQVLMDRSENTFGGAITNILNMSDGLLSDIFNIKFICTFNADINKIDSALLRKGRCFAKYEFKELCAEKTKVLLNRRGIELNDYIPMTLANIYNYGDTDNQNITKRKIGFNAK